MKDASGRVLVASMLDSLLLQAYNNPSIIQIFTLLCGVHLQVSSNTFTLYDTSTFNLIELPPKEQGTQR